MKLTIKTKAKPFLKWAGGKRQLLPQIDKFLPETVKTGGIKRYVEPFIGSGAVFLHIAQKYPLRELYISDLNPELILAYLTVQNEVKDLIQALGDLQSIYLPLTDSARKDFYYDQRERFNAGQAQFDYGVFHPGWIKRTAQLIFLNRTCYNGLFRVNKRGAFNVPFGRYPKPKICDAANLRAVAAILGRTTIRSGAYDDNAAIIDANTFVYFDPPYRPISPTAHFTSYSQGKFDDNAQIALAEYYRSLDNRGAKLMLSNSDPHNFAPEDAFFQEAYAGFRIERVLASRRINSQAENRGPIYELLIMNYG